MSSDRSEGKGSASSFFKRLSRRGSSASEKNILSPQQVERGFASAPNSRRPSSSSSLISQGADNHQPPIIPGQWKKEPLPWKVSQSQTTQASPEAPSITKTFDNSDPNTSHARALAKADVKHLFSGAPEFRLETLIHGKSCPQAFYPLDPDLETEDLQDRRWVKHTSFGLATLHAHLPIPDQRSWQPSSLSPQRYAEAWRRPAFELGIFEAPNMLSIDGVEPGTVGMRYFLELPVADALRTEKQTVTEEILATRILDGAHMSSTEALDSLRHEDGTVMIGRNAPRQDRTRLIREGSSQWKKVGVRDIDVKTIAARLNQICVWHDEINDASAERERSTLLDKLDRESLHNELFEELLYLPQTVKGRAEPSNLKIQIEALVKVLTTPGAWIDFSLTEWRLRLGQILWESAPPGGRSSGDSHITCREERHWLLVQLLLAVELVIRLSTAIRVGIIHHSEGPSISPLEIHHFNSLRTRKVDWDLVLARRFLDHLFVKKPSAAGFEPSSLTEPQKTTHIFSRTKQKHERVDKKEKIIGDLAWDCVILPRRARCQLDGLLRFAYRIDWPNYDKFEADLVAKLHESTSKTSEPPESIYNSPLYATQGSSRNELSVRALGGHKSFAYLVRHIPLALQAATPTSIGGWASRSWLTGLVLPGDTTPHILISTLLENDPESLKKLGDAARLCGGFVLDGRSWWSKYCIVGRTAAPYDGGSECIGWISTPKIVPVDAHGQRYANGWLELEVLGAPKVREHSRIHDGQKMLEESNTLGTGEGTVLVKEFVMPTETPMSDLTTNKVSLLAVTLANTAPRGAHASLKANIVFSIDQQPTGIHSKVTFNLTYDVFFISAYSCRVPHGHVLRPAEKAQGHPSHVAGEFLPSHPLHHTFKYSFKTIANLSAATPPNPTKVSSDVWIIDARSDRSTQVFVRAWCSSVGAHALVARTGKTCLSCAVREARALQVGVIIRVGGAL